MVDTWNDITFESEERKLAKPVERPHLVPRSTVLFSRMR